MGDEGELENKDDVACRLDRFRSTSKHEPRAELSPLPVLILGIRPWFLLWKNRRVPNDKAQPPDAPAHDRLQQMLDDLPQQPSQSLRNWNVSTITYNARQYTPQIDHSISNPSKANSMVSATTSSPWAFRVEKLYLTGHALIRIHVITVSERSSFRSRMTTLR